MKRTIKAFFIAALCTFVFLPIQTFGATEMNKIDDPTTIAQIFAQVKKNNDWKLAFLTGKNAQIVFMSVSPGTNPKNEIGMETHNFDQIIFVVEGNAKAVLNGKESSIKSGDLIFIPQGVEHNVINLDPNKPLKILSVYSENDIAAKSTYKTKSDEPQG